MAGDRSEVRREAAAVWGIAWPVLCTNLLNVAVGIVDFKMVGCLGYDAIASVGMARQVMMFLMVLMVAISGGSSVLVAHAHGAGDRQRVSLVASRSLFLMVVAATVLVLPAGLLLSRHLLELLGGEKEVVKLGGDYLRILFLASPSAMLNFGVTGILLGVGRTKISLVLLIVVNVLNVALNFVFIFGVGPIPAYGVPGAALGTATARTIGSVAGLWIAASPRFPIRASLRSALALDVALLKKIIYLGGPRSLQGIVRNFSRLMTIRIITLLPDSTRAVSAYSVGMQVRMTSTFIGLAFMSAAMSRVGQNIGAEKPETAVKSGWLSAAMATGLMSVVACIFLLVPEAIVGFFTDDADVIAMGRTFFTVIALTEPLMALAFALGGALRGGGDPMSPFIYSSVSDLLVVIVAGYLLAVQFGMGFTGIAIGMAVSALTRAIPTVIKFNAGKWKSNRV